VLASGVWQCLSRCSKSRTEKHFPVKKGLLRRTVGQVYAVDGCELLDREGETLGLVGESGCGKSTVARTVMRLVEPTEGTIRPRRARHHGTSANAALRPHRRQMQIVFQDPFASLDPRMSAGDNRRRALLVHGLTDRAQRLEQVAALFEQVGLRPAQMRAFPHEFSGGQRQRICIARALALNPKLIVGDEPVSALDVSIQAQVITLMVDLQREKRLSYLFIAHDLAVVEHISHRIAVMYLGRIVRIRRQETLFRRPLHPYTRRCCRRCRSPDPKVKRRKRVLQGERAEPGQSAVRLRVPYALPPCDGALQGGAPKLIQMAPGNLVACHLHEAGVSTAV